MRSRPAFTVVLGALLVGALGYVGSQKGAESLAQRLDQRSKAALSEAGLASITADFQTRYGSPTRHPMLAGARGLDEGKRDQAAKLVAGLPGVGGVSWRDGWANATSGESNFEPLHCQDDVQGLLRERSVRFEEGSAELLPASDLLLREVAEALRPCLGAIIAVTGHTDRSGPEPANIELSMDRARSVREALIQRGIPRDGLRARGVGSSQPVEGLTPEDPANRRIEFSVIRIDPVTPTPVDTPGPR